MDFQLYFPIQLPSDVFQVAGKKKKSECNENTRYGVSKWSIY